MSIVLIYYIFKNIGLQERMVNLLFKNNLETMRDYVLWTVKLGNTLFGAGGMFPHLNIFVVNFIILVFHCLG